MEAKEYIRNNVPLVVTTNLMETLMPQVEAVVGKRPKTMAMVRSKNIAYIAVTYPDGETINTIYFQKDVVAKPTLEDCQNAALELNDNGVGLRNVAVVFGVTLTTINNWVKQAKLRRK